MAEPKRNVVLVTVATRAIPQLEYLLSSAMHHGMYVNVLGMGDKRITLKKRQYHAKVQLFRDFIERSLENGTVKPQDLVVFLDAYDVIQNGGRDAILEGWKRAGYPELLVSMETNCHPKDPDAKAKQDEIATEMGYHGRFKYVNSGTIAGTAAAFYKALTTFPELQIHGDDQGMWTQAYLAHRNEMNFRADRERHMFAVLHGDGSVAKTMQKTSPFLHFNGGTAKLQLPLVFALMYPNLLTPESKTVYVAFLIAFGILMLLFLGLFIAAFFKRFPGQKQYPGIQ